jgi:hypothetical protein
MLMRDSEGNLYEIPADVLEKHKVTGRLGPNRALEGEQVERTRISASSKQILGRTGVRAGNAFLERIY